MPTAAPILLSFNAGELSPLLDSRIDLAAYASGCRQLQNFIPLRQGAASRRPGTRYVAKTKNEFDRGWLGRFVFDENDAYILEFGDLYIRFFTQGGVLEVSPGVPLEVVTPWEIADLTNEDGAFALQWAQSQDIIWFAGGGKPPQKLSRKAALDWTLEPMPYKGGPFREKNNTDTSVKVSQTTGNGATLTATDDIFLPGHVGGLFRLWDKNPNLMLPWEAGKNVNSGSRRRSDGKFYRSVTGGTTGGTKPVHERGRGSDGQIDWIYINPGFGIATITSVTSPTVAVCDIILEMPNTLVSTGGDIWEFGAWSEEYGYPDVVSFYRERLVFAKNRWRWFSKVDDFENFEDQTANQVLAENAITIRVNGDRINVAKWLVDAERLGDGTNGGEFIIGKITDVDPFGPENVEARPATKYGSAAVRPEFCHDRILFVDRTKTTVREYAYSFQNDSYRAPDLTRLASHIARGKIIDMAWQSSPLDILWCVLEDGTIAALTYDPNEEIFGWHRHIMGGDLIAEAVESIPLEGTTSDELWLIVRNNAIGGRWVIRMTDVWTLGTSRTEAFFVDAGLTYTGAPATVITGLDHLEGQVVAVLADGSIPFSPENRPMVTNGEIEIPYPASVVHVGLPYTSVLEPMFLEAGSADGTAQSKRKHMHEIWFRVADTRALLVGPSEDKLFSLDKRSPSTPMGTAEPLTNGLILARGWPGGYTPDNRIVCQTDEPLPVQLLSIMPRVKTNG